MIERIHNFSLSFGKRHSPLPSKKSSFPLKDHPQFPLLVDILIRKNCHHVILRHDYAHKFQLCFWEAFLTYLQQEQIPSALRGAELLELNLATINLSATSMPQIESEIDEICELLDISDKYLLIALQNVTYPLISNQSDPSFLNQQLQKLFNHAKCRCLLLERGPNLKKYDPDQFALIYLTQPSENDVLALLRQERLELEQYHHVVIPEELLGQAYVYAERYLSASHVLEKSILLLDSSAAHVQAMERNEVANARPALSLPVMLNVLSSWTAIPPSHLQLNKFKSAEFFQGMQQRVYGQEYALSVIQQEIKHAHTHLQTKRGPFCRFLLTGPKHTGKKTTAFAFVEQLFNQLNVLHVVPAHQSIPFIQLATRRFLEHKKLSLKRAITEMPHAAFLFENIELASPTIIAALEEIFATGQFQYKNQCYDFRQSIIILSSTLGSNFLNTLHESTPLNEEKEELNLMQLLVSEQKEAPSILDQHYTAQDIVAAILPEIKNKLPETFYNQLPIAPFIPLTRISIENIIRLKLKILCKQLDSRYGIELGYAPEIIHYLTKEVLHKTTLEEGSDINRGIKQLYLCIEQALQNQHDNKNRSNQLFLQLNETGQLLRCDWLLLTGMRQHTH